MADDRGLQLGPDLCFPLDAITQSIALLAIKRAGKSNAAAVMAEEMFRAGLPWVAIDPKGDWWGLRSDGDGPGLQIPIFGGLRGDLPLLPEAGPVIAELIVSQNLTCILDVSEFDSDAQQMRFLTDFAKRLFRLHGKEPQPRMIFLEEADEFIPQTVRADQAPCVGAWSKLVKQGGQRGLGVTIISQRSAVVNKNCLSQCDTLVALRTTGALDRKAISDWVSYHQVAQELVASLPGLDDGEAWVVSPHWLGKNGQPATQRKRFRRRETFDSGATPEVGKIRRPASLADIDLAAVQASMTAVIEKAAQDDPAKLRRRIAELERQAKAAQPRRGQMPDEEWRLAEVGKLKTQVAELQRQLAEAAEPERVEVPVLSAGDIAALEQSIAAVQSVAATIELALSRATRPAPAPPRQTPAQRPVVPAQAAASGSRNNPGITEAGSATSLPKAQRLILTVLAQFPDGRTMTQLGMLTGYSSKGGGFRNSLSALRTAGYITRGEIIRATAEGIAALGDDWEPLPAGRALLDHWLSQLGRAEREILTVLVDAWPESLNAAEIAARTESQYSPSGGGYRNALSRLRTLLLITGSPEMRADDTLAQAARETV